MLRIDKYLADASLGTRTEVKKMIQKKRVCVNGNVVTDPSFKVDEINDIITAFGGAVKLETVEYFMLNKPAGVVSATRDNQTCVVELIFDKTRKDLFPVGRLDKDTEGLLLITNDGKLAHKLLSPKKHVDKKYYVELDKKLENDMILRLKAGIDIGDEKPTKPCSIEQVSEYSCFITISEGRYHQIKRMFETENLSVTYLKRISMGPLFLDEKLKPGEYRKLSDEEIRELKDIYNE